MARQRPTLDDDMAPDPAATPDLHWISELGAAKTISDLSIQRVAWWVDLHIRPKEAVVPNLDGVAVQEAAVEVDVHALAKLDVVSLQCSQLRYAAMAEKWPSQRIRRLHSRKRTEAPQGEGSRGQASAVEFAP